MSGATLFALLALVPRMAAGFRDAERLVPGVLGSTLVGVGHLAVAASVVIWEDGWWAMWIGAEALVFTTFFILRRR